MNVHTLDVYRFEEVPLNRDDGLGTVGGGDKHQVHVPLRRRRGDRNPHSGKRFGRRRGMQHGLLPPGAPSGVTPDAAEKIIPFPHSFIEKQHASPRVDLPGGLHVVRIFRAAAMNIFQYKKTGSSFIFLFLIWYTCFWYKISMSNLLLYKNMHGIGAPLCGPSRTKEL